MSSEQRRGTLLSRSVIAETLADTFMERFVRRLENKARRL